MVYLEWTFWLCLLAVAYTYLFYPLSLFVVYAAAQVRRDLVYLLNRHDRRTSSCGQEQLPRVSLVVPVYNEADVLNEKIANLRALDYPADKLEVFFVSDGSTDDTNRMLLQDASGRFRVAMLPERSGKARALNEGVSRARGDILVLSDASTLFAPDAIRKMVRHFAEPKVGVVCGALKFRASPESEQTEGIYWKYESLLRLMEARLGATLTASGAIYALRRECFRPLDPDTILDDFVIPMNARKMGYRVVYDPEAEAVDHAASTVGGEFVRRVRLAAGSFKAFGELARIPLDGITCFAFFSHKFMRWVFPLFLLGLLASNIVLCRQQSFQIALFGQLFFYALAFWGFALRKSQKGARPARVCYYLLAMHLAFVVGFVRFFSGRDSGVWQKAH